MKARESSSPHAVEREAKNLPPNSARLLVFIRTNVSIEHEVANQRVVSDEGSTLVDQRLCSGDGRSDA
jgi:hypothetical protein